MNIAIFTNNYLPNPYGVTRSIETFRQELEKRGPASTRGNDCSSTRGGHEVFIFAPFWKGYKDQDMPVFRYPSIDVKIKFRFPLPIPYSRQIDKIIEKLDLDIIHAQHPNLLGTAAMKWARKKKIPLIFTWHTLYDKYTNFVPFLPAKVSAGYIIKKAVKFANQADAAIVPTDSIIPIIRKWGVVNRNIIPIATGVLEEEFANPDKDKVRKKYGIGENEIVLLLVSRLTAEKNVEFVFRSVSAILKNKNLNPPLPTGEDVLCSRQERVLSETKEVKGKIEFKDFHKEPSPELDYQLDLSRRERWGKVKLLVVGDGYLRRELENFCQKENISEKVIFCEEVERREIKNYYACSDIFVYGSKSETQGMIITEAMYMGLPIVAVDATGINSLVLNNGNGFLVSEKEKEFEDAVEKLISNQELRNKFSEASARIARMKFTASICAEKMSEVYKKAIKDKKQNKHKEA